MERFKHFLLKLSGAYIGIVLILIYLIIPAGLAILTISLLIPGLISLVIPITPISNLYQAVIISGKFIMVIFVIGYIALRLIDKHARGQVRRVLNKSN